MVRHDSDSDSDNNSDTTRYDTMPRETIRYDADTIWIRCGYGATRYDTLVRDSDDSPPPDRVRETIKFCFDIEADCFLVRRCKTNNVQCNVLH